MSMEFKKTGVVRVDGDIINENLAPCGGTYTETNPWTTTKNNADGYAWITNSAFEGIPSTTYTISVECDGTLANTHSASANGASENPSNKYWTFWLYICNTNTTKSWSTGAYDTPVNLTNANYNYRKIGNRHVWTYTLSSTQKYISLRTNSYSDGSTNVTINWWNIKVEEGEVMTAWVPNEGSDLYTSNTQGAIETNQNNTRFFNGHIEVEEFIEW